MTSKKTYAVDACLAVFAVLAFIVLQGCAEDHADPAPDAPSPVACYDCEPVERNTSAEKSTLQWVAPSWYGDAPYTAGQYDWIDGPGWDDSTCWYKNREYGVRSYTTNNTGSNNIPERWWSFTAIDWTVCAPGITGAFTANTIIVCRDGLCVDTTNRYTSNTGGCRRGTVTASMMPMSIAPGATKHIDLFVRLREGSWMANPQVHVSMSLGYMRVWN